MLISRRTPIFLLIFTVLLLGANRVSAQDETKNNQSAAEQSTRQSYEVTLQLLQASDAPNESNNQTAPAAIQRKIKSEFGFNNSRIVLNVFSRMSGEGRFEMRGVLPFAFDLQNNQTSFYELTINTGSANRTPRQLPVEMRFGFRLPVITGNIEKDGKSRPVYNYEQTGITLNPVRLNFNEPTVVGTMTTARPNELLILVLTVKPVEAAR